MSCPTCLSDKLPSSGDINTNEYKINTPSLHNVKKNNGSYKYKNVNTIHVTLTICTETSRTEVFDQKGSSPSKQ